MNILLIFFALPIATIIISIALQKILKCPLLVAAIIFSIFLIVTFVVGNLNFLVAAIIYAIISFITAFLTCLICRFLNTYNSNIRRCCCDNNNSNNVRRQNDLLTISSSCRNNGNGELLTISSNGCNGNVNDLLTISSNNTTNNNCNNCNCNCNNFCSDNSNNTVNFSNGVSARINVIPNNTNSGRTGCISGCYRRR